MGMVTDKHPRIKALVEFQLGKQMEVEYSFLADAELDVLEAALELATVVVSELYHENTPRGVTPARGMSAGVTPLNGRV
jgi:hypothetical protein